MSRDDASTTTLEAAAERSSQRAVEAFELLGNGTRLSILLALWEAYEPFADENTVPFSELRERVGIRQGAQFNYHLDKLVGRFVEKTDDGYELRRAGHRIVRSVIAGAGLSDPSSDPTEIGIDCPFCDAPTAVLYRNEWLYIVCTECDGAFEGEGRPGGMLTGTEFDPAGLPGRTAEQQWRTGWLVARSAMHLSIEGICNECSGPMEQSLDVCADHETDGVCESCGREFDVIVRFRCSVCKNHHRAPPRTLVIHHPAVVSFYYDRGIDFQYDDGSFDRISERGELIAAHDQELVSADPPRIRVTIDHEDDELRLTLDGDMNVLETELESAGGA